MIEIPTTPQSIDDSGDFDPFVTPRAKFGAHHILWLECLQKVEDGLIPRLMGLMPPGAGKSIYTSVVFPTHFLGRFPNKSVMVASYGSELPRKFGLRARSIVNQTIYRRIFDCGLSEESAAADEWALTNGSEWMARGILSGITGNRADGVIWDDIMKGRAEADSPQIRNKTYDAYVNDLLTRKKPSAFEVCINTRWHEDDPSGRILPEDYNGESGLIKCRDGYEWYVVCLAAECERADDPLGRKIGDRLWPEWFGPDHFTGFKRNARAWNCLFQQRPAPEDGDYFKAEWLKPYGANAELINGEKTKLPDRRTMHIYGASDYAVSDGTGDYTVHIVVGVDPKGQIWLLDLWRKQCAPDQWIESFCDLVAQWKPMGWAREKGQIKSGVGPFLNKRMRERKTYVPFADFPSTHDKRIRATSIRGRMAMDGLMVPTYESWYPQFLDELMKFDAGRHDDQVDALSLIGQVLDKMISGHAAPAEASKPKVFSTDPTQCTVTLNDLWDAHDSRDNNTEFERIR